MAATAIQCRVRALDHLVLTVASIPETVRFYTQVLGMRGKQFEAADGSRRWALHFGQSKINLHQKGQTITPRAAHPHPGTADLCFLSEASIEEWQEHLETHQVDVETGPVKRTGARGTILSLYVRDPDDNLIEIATAFETD
jgi:catechol 2,3-dioxygenase-like lactoylglutathione lyase family enzyme